MEDRCAADRVRGAVNGVKRGKHGWCGGRGAAGGGKVRKRAQRFGVGRKEQSGAEPAVNVGVADGWRCRFT